MRAARQRARKGIPRRRRIPDESDRRSSIQSINLIVNHLAALFIARIFSRSRVEDSRKKEREKKRQREKERERERERGREGDQDGYTYYTRVSVQRRRGREGWNKKATGYVSFLLACRHLYPDRHLRHTTKISIFVFLFSFFFFLLFFLSMYALSIKSTHFVETFARFNKCHLQLFT
ncbi:hypothetical protein PUN28_014753 [Cardiocondyla obscurior]|uniref:Transmembrane protein n=1 Tax=Cardiocondyla obscurior TaxID=286306 RepID=A0AAW2EZ09_9HYME